jgi:hypothetical protein
MYTEGKRVFLIQKLTDYLVIVDEIFVTVNIVSQRDVLLSLLLLHFSHGSTDPLGIGHLYEVPRTHSDTPQSVELLCTSHHSDAESST